MPETTVLISTYNCENYIREALDSIKAQFYKDYEIIIIDDGSTDNTTDVISNYKGIRYYKNEINQGISFSLNKGIDLADSKYIARMDADDVMLGNRLEDQVDFLKNNKDYGMVGGWYRVMNEIGQHFNNITPYTDNDELRLALIFRNQFAQPTITARTELMKKLRYDTNLICAEDHDLWIRFSEVSKIANLPSFYLSYRWHKNSTCNIRQKELKLSILQLFSRELDKLLVIHTKEELMLHAAASFGLGRAYFIEPDRRKRLQNWYDKIFNSPILNEGYSVDYLNSFKRKILKEYCNI